MEDSFEQLDKVATTKRERVTSNKEILRVNIIERFKNEKIAGIKMCEWHVMTMWDATTGMPKRGTQTALGKA
ncbi:MAG: hypothetical protein AAFU67_14490, partial [Bacteroidota bacterium]